MSAIRPEDILGAEGADDPWGDLTDVKEPVQQFSGRVIIACSTPHEVGKVYEKPMYDGDTGKKIDARFQVLREVTYEDWLNSRPTPRTDRTRRNYYYEVSVD